MKGRWLPATGERREVGDSNRHTQPPQRSRGQKVGCRAISSNLHRFATRSERHRSCVAGLLELEAGYQNRKSLRRFGDGVHSGPCGKRHRDERGGRCRNGYQGQRLQGRSRAAGLEKIRQEVRSGTGVERAPVLLIPSSDPLQDRRTRRRAIPARVNNPPPRSSRALGSGTGVIVPPCNFIPLYEFGGLRSEIR